MMPVLADPAIEWEREECAYQMKRDDRIGKHRRAGHEEP